MRATFALRDPHQGHAAFSALWSRIKPVLADGKTIEVSVRPARRSTEQNAKFHALCADIARSGITWAGKRRTAAQWKVLLVSGHATATKEGAEMVPGIEGEFVNIRESTALMSKTRSSSLIEYALAFCAAHDVHVLEIDDATA